MKRIHTTYLLVATMFVAQLALSPVQAMQKPDKEPDSEIIQFLAEEVPLSLKELVLPKTSSSLKKTNLSLESSKKAILALIKTYKKARLGNIPPQLNLDTEKKVLEHFSAFFRQKQSPEKFKLFLQKTIAHIALYMYTKLFSDCQVEYVVNSRNISKEMKLFLLHENIDISDPGYLKKGAINKKMIGQSNIMDHLTVEKITLLKKLDSTCCVHKIILTEKYFYVGRDEISTVTIQVSTFNENQKASLQLVKTIKEIRSAIYITLFLSFIQKILPQEAHYFKILERVNSICEQIHNTCESLPRLDLERFWFMRNRWWLLENWINELHTLV